MAKQPESKRVGVLAEWSTDCDVLKEIIRRVRQGSEPLGVNAFNARGCANLRRKLIPRIKVMLGAGCTAFIIVHDPHEVVDPKGALKELSKRNGKSQYSPNENEELAGLLNLKLCAERCPEFAELCHFVAAL